MERPPSPTIKLTSSISTECFDLTKTKSISASRSGRLSPPPSSRDNILHNEGNESYLKSNSGVKPRSNEERIESIFQRVLQLDPEEHERRSILLNSAILFLPKPKTKADSNQSVQSFSPSLFKLVFDVLLSIFSTPPPFSVITKSYRQIYFHSRDHPADVTVSYKI